MCAVNYNKVLYLLGQRRIFNKNMYGLRRTRYRQYTFITILCAHILKKSRDSKYVIYLDILFKNLKSCKINSG